MSSTISLSLATLSGQASRVMFQIQEMGDHVPHGTALGDHMLRLMDIVIEMDSAIEEAQRAVAFIGSSAFKRRLSRQERQAAEEEQAELLQARRDRRAWEEERQTMERKLMESELKVKNLQELNSMLMERGTRATTPSSGYCTAAHSPQSPQPQEEDTVLVEPASAVQEEQQQKMGPVRMTAPVIFVAPPPKPERKHSIKMPVLTLDETPEFEAVPFRDSIQPHSARKPASCVDMDNTIQLFDSPEVQGEGPLCSTFKEERSIYVTPTTSKKMRRRSSSLGDVMKKIFTPSKKVKNPVLESIDD